MNYGKLVIVLVCGLVLTACSAPHASKPSPLVSATPKALSVSDRAYLAAVTNALDPDPTMGALRLKALDPDQVLVVGKRDCKYLEAGQYGAASRTVQLPGETPAWATIDPFVAILPAAMATWCPEVTAKFNTWANTPAGPPVPLNDPGVWSVSSNYKTSTSISFSAGPSGQVTQANGAALPWSENFLAPHADLAETHATIVAQSGSGAADTTITCAISVAGTVLQTNTSTGAYAVVTCSL